MNETEFLTLNGLISMLQNYKKEYGGNIPVLLADGDSPNSMTSVVDTFVIDIMDTRTDEAQTIVLLTNMTQEQLLGESDLNFDGEGDE